jgi:hypothetical protein
MSFGPSNENFIYHLEFLMVLKVCDSANKKYGDFSISNVKNMNHIFKISNVAKYKCIQSLSSFIHSTNSSLYLRLDIFSFNYKLLKAKINFFVLSIVNLFYFFLWMNSNLLQLLSHVNATIKWFKNSIANICNFRVFELHYNSTKHVLKFLLHQEIAILRGPN